MTIEQAPNTTAALIGSLIGVVTPFARQLAYGRTRAGDIALQEERNRFNTLNGSGANNPALAQQQAPHGILDQLFGSPLQRTSGDTSTAGGLTLGRIAVLGALAFGAFYVLKKI